MFTLRIKDLQATTLLGIFDWEKQARRLVVLNIELTVDTGKAGISDDIQDAVDYAMIEQHVLTRLEGSSYNLIERLVTDIAEFILTLDMRIATVSVEADKPGALRCARSVSISRVFTRSSV